MFHPSMWVNVLLWITTLLSILPAAKVSSFLGITYLELLTLRGRCGEWRQTTIVEYFNKKLKLAL